GRVLINAKGIFGTQFREFITPKSDITATSGLGAEFNGVVDINTITTTPNSGLIELPNNLTNSSQKIAAKCGESRVNKFTVTGRGGLPESPNQLFRGGIILVDLVDLVPASKNQQNSISSISRINNSIDNSNNNTEKEIVEAKGWIVDAQGNIEFVAEVPNFISNSGTITQPDCQTFG
ncbi:MAG: filamentous hemagglutinin, partial [Rivularia sp. ALOHA_DT_140]|nr:filamentous hemagglutinin [Rivularia sp. ALOHA_DT_140]